MAGSGILAILDDIAALGDDVAAMTKVATKKTAGIIGDDIALNAKQVIGVRKGRELPVVGKVMLGSLVNKAILVPAFFGMSMVAGGALIPYALLAGGAYLCYEGAEKVWHAYAHKEDHAKHKKHVVDTAHNNPEQSENEKVMQAIKTDFILSAEIIAIALGSIAAATTAPMTVLASLAAVGVVTSVGVYAVVGAFVSIDDVGLWLAGRKGDNFVMDGVRAVGRGMVNAMPYMSKGLSLFGTAAMFMVGGGIFLHNIPALAGLSHAAVHAIEALPYMGTVGAAVAEFALPGLAGVVAGAASLPLINKVVAPATSAVFGPVVRGVKSLFGKNKTADTVEGKVVEHDVTPEVKAETKDDSVDVSPKPAEPEQKVSVKSEFAGEAATQPAETPKPSAEMEKAAKTGEQDQDGADKKAETVRRMPHFYI